ncbi:MAG: hypothetical protein WA061_02050 [Microgenomates group bacterium]
MITVGDVLKFKELKSKFLNEEERMEKNYLNTVEFLKMEIGKAEKEKNRERMVALVQVENVLFGFDTNNNVNLIDEILGEK